MKTYIVPLALLLALGVSLTSTTWAAQDQTQELNLDEPAAAATPTPAPPSPTPTAETPTPTPAPGKASKQPVTEKALVVHKPMPNPVWGKVIQYHREQNFTLSETNREITHEFLFQDEEGIIRTAIFHENSTGGGYWEVWVWDQR